MSNLVLADKVADVLLHGDLRSLTDKEKTAYAQNVCDALGLNIMTKPFDFLTLNGKLTMYATKSCTDQLRKIHEVSITKLEKEVVGDIYTVTAYARDKTGKEDSDTGAVDISGLKGEKLANAMLKCITKAKRRVTLSICGLGLLDETEIQDIPREEKAAAPVGNPFKEEQPKGFVEHFTEAAIAARDFKEEEENLGAYVINVGRKHKGKRLDEMDIFELDNYIQWLKNSTAEQNKELSGAALEFVEVAEAFMKSREFEPK